MKVPRTLLVEGWRFIPHSYSLVNQFQCLQLLKEPNLKLRHHDVTYFEPAWQPVEGLFPEADERILRGLAAPPKGETPDAVFRIAYPYNLAPSVAGRTVVFGTAEFQCVPAKYMAGQRSLKEACRDSDALIVTPSNWSRAGFIHSGADPDRVVVVPHGVDTSLFHPLDAAQRSALRARHGLNGFVFLHLGAMTPSKRVDALLKAFAVVAQKHPDVRLVLKGLDDFYSSEALLKSQAGSLTAAEVGVIQSRVHYHRNTLSFHVMAELYQVADAYVAPYAAEGFNLPVLEAVACGLPVICTRGGSTDDFTRDDFALRVNAEKFAVQQTPDAAGFGLNIDFDHLVHQMMFAVESADWAARVRAAGPPFVAAEYTWEKVTQKLLRVLFDAGDFA